MASSDDEPESHPLSVSNYHFEDDRDAPVSFSVMPIQWSGSESPQGKKTELFLHGVADNGLQKVMMPVMAWRFELSSVKPEISVLSSKDRRWIKLEKPRKSYEDIVRSILVTVYFLSFAKKNPDATAKAAWDSLSKNKDSYEVTPSANDLVNQKALMSEAAKRDALLAKSKFRIFVAVEVYLEEEAVVVVGLVLIFGLGVAGGVLLGGAVREGIGLHGRT
ncbi:hypothetical protein Ahy_A01g004669 isoform E [Arachis hypogaea]|uniref:RFTS domain-containing protein n=1 Tax=Arachis hypogaea TaxID=3818 RepID=A0A445EWQ6_ARAHY|nr:hypothetical protein Ahy_A01g004669 isoform E [Arachis hypogaea]